MGNLISGSGWEDIVYQAELSSSGDLMAILAGTHYNRAWFHHSSKLTSNFNYEFDQAVSIFLTTFKYKIRGYFISLLEKFYISRVLNFAISRFQHVSRVFNFAIFNQNSKNREILYPRDHKVPFRRHRHHCSLCGVTEKGSSYDRQRFGEGKNIYLARKFRIVFKQMCSCAWAACL